MKTGSCNLLLLLFSERYLLISSSYPTYGLITTALGIIFLVLCLLVVAFFFYYGGIRSQAKKNKAGSDVRWLFRIIFIMFIAVYGYQATWQLAGFARPSFMAFMRTYSRRPINPAKETLRGRILDRNGVELAVNDGENTLKRKYPFDKGFCHLVGYMDTMFGLAGLEAADNAFLDGYSLTSAVEVGRFGLNIVNHRRVGGNDLVLTVDSVLQKEAVRLLGKRRGAVVALQPHDGSILVLASSPGYNPQALKGTLFDDERDDSSPLMNRAIHGLYPPGSIFKIVVAALALEKGFSERLDCPAQGYVPAGGRYRPVRDHEYYAFEKRGETWQGRGRIGIEEAFVFSSNVYFAQLGVRLGNGQLNEIAQRFLFNRPIALFEGSSGSMTARPGKWPELNGKHMGNVAQQAIGQGAILVTPLQMALITAAIAQDGELYAPRIASRIPPRLLGRPTDPAVAQKLKVLMRNTVERGTAVGARIKGPSIAGKTGTAQVPDGADHSWFVCFAPVERPAIALAVLIEHGGYGAASALPVAVELVKKAKGLGLLETQDTQTMGTK
jgi:peptidoglycan glycosyltransferase